MSLQDVGCPEEQVWCAGEGEFTFFAFKEGVENIISEPAKYSIASSSYTYDINKVANLLLLGRLYCSIENSFNMNINSKIKKTIKQ